MHVRCNIWYQICLSEDIWCYTTTTITPMQSMLPVSIIMMLGRYTGVKASWSLTLFFQILWLIVQFSYCVEVSHAHTASMLAWLIWGDIHTLLMNSGRNICSHQLIHSADRAVYLKQRPPLVPPLCVKTQSAALHQLQSLTPCICLPAPGMHRPRPAPLRPSVAGVCWSVTPWWETC